MFFLRIFLRRFSKKSLWKCLLLKCLLFVCLFVCLFLSYIRPALAWEHAGVYLGMATTATSIFGLYRNYLGKFTDVLFWKLSKPVFATKPETEKRTSFWIICMENENECLTFIFATHADRFLWPRNGCDEENSVSNVHVFIIIFLWFASMPIMNACMINQIFMLFLLNFIRCL